MIIARYWNFSKKRLQEIKKDSSAKSTTQEFPKNFMKGHN